MKNFLKKCFAPVLAGLGVAVAAVTNASAAITLPTSIAITDMETYAGVILAALAGMWIIRKLIKTTNKS